MADDALVRDSRFLSRVLRHAPASIGLELDDAGWASVDALLDAARAHGRALGRERLLEIVARNDKKRFALDEGGHRIRAVQGHSVAIDLGLAPVEPPARLYHGTATRHLPGIRREGLTPRTRRHVHLSAMPGTARAVGARHGTPVVLGVRADAMHAAGHVFHRAQNGVWLTAAVPPGFLELPASRSET